MSKSEAGASLEKSEDFGATFLHTSNDWAEEHQSPLDGAVLPWAQSSPQGLALRVKESASISPARS